MKRKRKYRGVASILLILTMICSLLPVNYLEASSSSDNGDGTFTNPVIYADVPDLFLRRRVF